MAINIMGGGNTDNINSEKRIISGGVTNILLNPKLNTVKKGNSEITIFSERGGLIVSIKINGTEILYQDMYEETLFDTSKSVKGGIPFMFPNAGPISEEQNKKLGTLLPQHGIGRISEWQKIEENEDGKISQNLIFDENDQKFPYKGEILSTTEIIENGAIINHEITNTGEKTFPISTGLHPYFRIPRGKKEEIEWRFNGGEKVKEQIDSWGNDKPISFDNPETPIKIFIPDLGELTIEVSTDYKKFWVRSIPGKDFVCIEPVMNDVGGIVNNPINLKKLEKNTNFMRIYLKN